MERRNTFRNDWFRGKSHGLRAAADALDIRPDQVATYAEVAAWLRGRAEWSTRDVPAPTDRSVSPITDDMVEAAAKELRSEYDSEFDAAHLSWQDFTGTARKVLTAALGGASVGCTAATSGALVSPEQTTDHAHATVTDAMVQRGADAIECLLQMLGVPKGQPSGGYQDEPYAVTVSRAVLRAGLAGCTAPSPDKAKLLGLIEAVLRGHIYKIGDYMDSEDEPMKVIPAEDIAHVISELDRRWNAPAFQSAAGSQVGDQHG